MGVEVMARSSSAPTAAPDPSGWAQMAIARYTSNGTLDSTFGTGGIVTADTTAMPSANAMAIASDGKVVLAGYAYTDGWQMEFAVVRYGMPSQTAGVTQRLYAQHDANFNITAMVDNSGAVVQRFVYTPYGVQTELTGAWAVSGDAHSVYGDQGDDMILRRD